MNEIPAKVLESEQRKPFKEAFDSLFPMDKFDKSTRWTKQGSTEGMGDITQEFMAKLLKGEPEIGVIKIQRLPDGGYEVRSYKSNE